jgi:hypothetical protein
MKQKLTATKEEKHFLLYSLDLLHKVRDSTEINFAGISIGIPTEINFDFRQNYWLKLSKLIGISILILISR